MTIELVDILLVEDNRDEVKAICDAFAESRLANVVQVATDGVEAMAYLRREGKFKNAIRPGLVLIDLAIDMTRKHGIEVLSDIKDDQVLRSIPVIVLTESQRDADVLEAYAGGACSFVPKPVGLRRLGEVVKQLAQYWSLVAQIPRDCGSSSRVVPAAGSRSRQTWDLPDSREFSYEKTNATSDQPLDILVVDDNDDDIFVLRKAFKDSHLVNVLAFVEDGDEALAYLRREGRFQDAKRPGMVLLDINMPKKNGFEVLAEMQDDPVLRTIPIVMLTTSRRDTDILKAYADGACSFISKPVDFGKMQEVAQHFAMYWGLVANVPRGK